jgi:hypothetical protein
MPLLLTAELILARLSARPANPRRHGHSRNAQVRLGHRVTSPPAVARMPPHP